MGFMQAPAAAGDFVTFIKYDARAGRWYTKPEGGGEVYEVANMTAIADLENIRTGWFHFSEGQGPSRVFDASLDKAAAKPGEGFKRGFEVLLYSEPNIGGLREFTATAKAVIDAMNDVYDDWQSKKAANAGKLPVIKCEGVRPVKSGQSTNYQPSFKIVAWADRPAQMVNGEAVTGATANAPAVSVAPPPPPPPSAPAAASEDADAPVF